MGAKILIDRADHPLIEAICSILSSNAVYVKWHYGLDDRSDLSCSFEYRLQDGTVLKFVFYEGISYDSFGGYINENDGFELWGSFLKVFKTRKFPGMNKIVALLKKIRNGTLDRKEERIDSVLETFIKEIIGDKNG